MDPITPGETVYLLAELPAGGRIHEIGSRALVRRADGEELTLELGGAAPDLVSLPAAHVLRSRLRKAHPATLAHRRRRFRPV